MSRVTKPELSREERLVRDYLLPHLPSGFREPQGMSEEEIEITKSILAEQYVEKANLDLLWKTMVIFVLYDLLFRLDSQVYGLTLGALGSLALALPNLYTPELLAEDVFENSEERMARIRSKAELSVKTNVGVAGLFIGFIWQMLAIVETIPEELLTLNYLQNYVPSWVGFVVVLVAALVVLNST